MYEWTQFIGHKTVYYALIMNITLFKTKLVLLYWIPITIYLFLNLYLWIWQRFHYYYIIISPVCSDLQDSHKEQSLLASPGIKGQCVMFIFKLVFMFAFLGMIVLPVIAVLFLSWVHNNSDSVYLTIKRNIYLLMDTHKVSCNLILNTQ